MLNSLQKIKDSSVLDNDDLAALQDLMPGIEQSIQSHTIYRTTTEALFSVLNDLKFPTAASKYHQAKREQLVMFENLVGLSFDYRAAVIELEEIESKISSSEGFKLKKLEVKRDRLQFKLMWMRKDGQERIRELKMWAQIMQELAESDVFDLDNKDTDELKAFTLRYLWELPAACRAGNDVGGAVNIIAQARTGLAECERRNIKLPANLVERSKRLLKGA
ncbi:MAG: hypothetical protein PHQ34_13815 [Methanothrix sp.]|nr:hypothetical protein [Methanothrix sp.]